MNDLHDRSSSPEQATTTDDDRPSTERTDIMLWTLLVVSVGFNAALSIAEHFFVSATFGVMAVVFGTALVRRRLRRRRA